MRRDLWRVWLGAPIVVALTAVVLAPAPAGATTVGDETTFRAAWTNASETTIDLSADITLTCGGGGVSTRNSATALTLDGHGHTIQQTCAANGVLAQTGTGTLTMSNVTVTGGAAPAGGVGGINGGDANVTLNDSSVTANHVSTTGGCGGVGGATITLNRSSVSGNQVNGSQGTAGVCGGTVVLDASTVSDNTLTGGLGNGGISGATVVLRNSTVSGNQTGNFSTAGVAAGTAILVNSTVSNNVTGASDANNVGGVRSSSITLVYSTVVQNSSPGRSNLGQTDGSTNVTSFGSVVALPLGGGTNCATGATTSNGFNFTDDTSCGFPAAETHAGVNPMLDALGANGGSTLTRVPQSGSPLVDAIAPASCQDDGASAITTDQRGLERPSPTGGACDIGAVEVQVAAPVVLAPTFTG